MSNYNTAIRRESRLDVLLNSGGVMFPPISQLTTHGHDLQFGTNVLGHFYLTQLLLPTLVSSAKTSSDSHTRGINLSSVGHIGAPSVNDGGPVVYDTLVKGKLRNKMGAQELYYQSKAVSWILRLTFNISSGSLTQFECSRAILCFQMP